MECRELEWVYVLINIFCPLVFRTMLYRRGLGEAGCGGEPRPGQAGEPSARYGHSSCLAQLSQGESALEFGDVAATCIRSSGQRGRAWWGTARAGLGWSTSPAGTRWAWRGLSPPGTSRFTSSPSRSPPLSWPAALLSARNFTPYESCSVY